MQKDQSDWLIFFFGFYFFSHAFYLFIYFSFEFFKFPFYLFIFLPILIHVNVWQKTTTIL